MKQLVGASLVLLLSVAITVLVMSFIFPVHAIGGASLPDRPALVRPAVLVDSSGGPSFGADDAVRCPALAAPAARSRCPFLAAHAARPGCPALSGGDAATVCPYLADRLHPGPAAGNLPSAPSELDI
jgi:hypothetical protein